MRFYVVFPPFPCDVATAKRHLLTGSLRYRRFAYFATRTLLLKKRTKCDQGNAKYRDK